MISPQLSRRSFLKSAAAGTGATAFSGESQSRPPDHQVCASTCEGPPKQHGNDVNLIFIISDTFRRDNLACYGKRWLESLETPNLDKFAQQAVIFEDFFGE